VIYRDFLKNKNNSASKKRKIYWEAFLSQFSLKTAIYAVLLLAMVCEYHAVFGE
jgi:hypothetical protein